MEMMLRIGSYRERTRSEGPGSRFALWVQGCSLRCSGCFNPHFWNPKQGTGIHVEEILTKILNAAEKFPDLEGVTFLGGEPFEQSEPLTQIAKLSRQAGLSVMVFTGYTIEELTDRSHSDFQVRKELLAQTDLLVDGRFEEGNLDLQRPWVGSTNQRFHFLTNRYRPKDIFQNSRDSIEITISPQGVASINGWAPMHQLEKILDKL